MVPSALQSMRHKLKFRDLDQQERGDTGEAALRHLMQKAGLVWMGIDQQKNRKASLLSDSKRPDFVIVTDGEATFLDAKVRKTVFPQYQKNRFAALSVTEKNQYKKLEELTSSRVFFVFFPSEDDLEKYIVMEIEDLSEPCKISYGDEGSVDALGLKLTAEIVKERFDNSSYKLT